MKQWAIRLMRMATGWVLVACLLLSYSSGMVLCIGSNGHVAVEPAHEHHCEDETGEWDDPQQQGAHLETFSHDDETHGCVDISLHLDQLSHFLKDLQKERLQRASFSKDLPPDFNSGLSIIGQRIKYLSNRAPPLFQLSLLAHRTIVLRL